MTFPTDAEILEASKHVDSLQKLWHALPEVRDFQAVRAACKRLGITFRTAPAGKPREARECLKADLPLVGKKRTAAPAKKEGDDA